MAKEDKENGGGGEGGGWLTTYTDLCTLLLTFFVLLLSMSIIDPEKKKEALSSLVGAFGFLTGGRAIIGNPVGTDIREVIAPIQPSSPISFEMLREMTLKNNLNLDVDIIKEKERIIIRINDRILFKKNSYQLSPKGEKFLAALGMYLKKSPEGIEVRGHADPYEMPGNPKWPKLAWELSARRALAVYKFLLDIGIQPNRISAHGMSYYWPVVNSLEMPHLRYKNRRVEIIIGRNPTIPASIYTQEKSPHGYVNYKNFFFRLFPSFGGKDRNAQKTKKKI